MREEAAYKFLKGSMGAEKAAAISKIFAIEHDIPEEREPVITQVAETMELTHEEAAKLVYAFLERRRLQ